MVNVTTETVKMWRKTALYRVQHLARSLINRDSENCKMFLNTV